VKFQPFGHLVLVKVLDLAHEIKKTSGIYLPDKTRGRFWKVEIVATGHDVPPGWKEGDMCLANPVAEVDDEDMLGEPGYRLLHMNNILGRWEK
jgi:co-chaperonin GroES (HSP10)